MPSAVVSPAMIIIRRTRLASSAACSASISGAAESVMGHHFHERRAMATASVRYSYRRQPIVAVQHRPIGKIGPQSHGERPGWRRQPVRSSLGSQVIMANPDVERAVIVGFQTERAIANRIA